VSTFRPSARVRLQIRLEEFGDPELRKKLEREPPRGGTTGAGQSPTESGGTEAQDANLEARRRLNQGRQGMAPTDVARQRSQLDEQRALLQSAAPEGGSQTVPLGLREDASDDRNVIFSTLPLSATISRNGIRDAGTCSLELDYRDVPVDPRIIRACFVSFALGVTSADEFEQGIHGKRRSDGSLLSLVPVESGQELNFQSSTRFVGFADEVSGDWEEGDTLTLECRDLSALLDRYDDPNRPRRASAGRPVRELARHRGGVRDAGER
jgi:hypothetical protein